MTRLAWSSASTRCRGALNRDDSDDQCQLQRRSRATHTGQHQNGLSHRRETCAMVRRARERFLCQARSCRDHPGRIGSADTVRTIAAGGADFGFADISTAIVARSRGTGVQVVGQLGYVAATILWREDSAIKGIKDLQGKSWAISAGQAQWF